MSRMTWLRHIYWPFSRHGSWPLRTPPTVAGREPLVFHCPRCHQDVHDDDIECPACGAGLGYREHGDEEPPRDGRH